MQLTTLIDGFFLDCKAKNLSRGTIERAYGPCLSNLSGWFNDHKAQDITTEHLRRFVIHLMDERGLSPWTVRNHVRTIKRLFSWAVSEGILSSPGPAVGLAYPKLPKGKIEIFSKDEIETLLAQAKATSFRNYVIVLTLLDSGLRREELASLTLDDVNPLSGVIDVRHGKGDKWRRVRVGAVCQKHLWLYVHEHRKPANPKVKALFLGRYGKPLTANGLALMLKRLGEKTDIHCHAHKFRHTFATLYALQVPNAILLADALGHESLTMARRYVHLAGTQSTDIVSPMNELFAQLGDL